MARKGRQLLQMKKMAFGRALGRRDFIAGGAAAFGAWFSGCSDVGARRRSYSVAVLGDTHFDSPDVKFYHADYTHSTTEKRYKGHLKEHVRNAAMWSERMPSLVRASAACVRDDTAFALQMGDLVQGDCGKRETHARMLKDAFGFIKGAYGGKLPLVTVVGNHDIRGDIEGDGAREAFEAWQPEVVNRELGIAAKGTTFSFRQGPDAFIVVDFNEPCPDMAVLRRLIRESEDARYLFLVTHGPAIPHSEGRWFLLGKKGRDDERRELRSLLARRNAIVLAGHTHVTELCDCELPEGRITQFVFNSVWSKPGLAEPTVVAKGADGFGGRAPESERHGDKAEQPSLVAEYRPFVRDFLLAKAAGHYRLEVSDAHVDVVFYGGDSTVPTSTFRLR